MSHADVYAAVSQHVPCRHMEWPEDSHPKLPFAVYLLDYDKPISAGDEQIAIRHKWIVELYESRRDAALETALADALRAGFGPITRDEQWVDDEGMLQVVYTFYQIEGEFDG